MNARDYLFDVVSILCKAMLPMLTNVYHITYNCRCSPPYHSGRPTGMKLIIKPSTPKFSLLNRAFIIFVLCSSTCCFSSRHIRCFLTLVEQLYAKIPNAIYLRVKCSYLYIAHSYCSSIAQKLLVLFNTKIKPDDTIEARSRTLFYKCTTPVNKNNFSYHDNYLQ